MLAELVELVIGVDTTPTPTPPRWSRSTPALCWTRTLSVEVDGYAQLIALAETYGGLRGWAIEGAGGGTATA